MSFGLRGVSFDVYRDDTIGEDLSAEESALMFPELTFWPRLGILLLFVCFVSLIPQIFVRGMRVLSACQCMHCRRRLTSILYSF